MNPYLTNLGYGPTGPGMQTMPNQPQFGNQGPHGGGYSMGGMGGANMPPAPWHSGPAHMGAGGGIPGNGGGVQNWLPPGGGNMGGNLGGGMYGGFQGMGNYSTAGTQAYQPYGNGPLSSPTGNQPRGLLGGY